MDYEEKYKLKYILKMTLMIISWFIISIALSHLIDSTRKCLISVGLFPKVLH